MVPSNTIIDNGNERYESTKSHIAETSVHSLLNLGMDVFGDEKSSYPRRRNYYRDGDLPLLTCSPRAAAPSPPPLSRCSFDRQEAGPEDPQSGRWWNPPGRDLAIGASGTVVGGGIDGGGGEEGAEGGAVLSGLAPLLWPALSSFFEVAAAGVEDGDTGGVLVEILEQVDSVEEAWRDNEIISVCLKVPISNLIMVLAEDFIYVLRMDIHLVHRTRVPLPLCRNTNFIDQFGKKFVRTHAPSVTELIDGTGRIVDGQQVKSSYHNQTRCWKSSLMLQIYMLLPMWLLQHQCLI